MFEVVWGGSLHDGQEQNLSTIYVHRDSLTWQMNKDMISKLVNIKKKRQVGESDCPQVGKCREGEGAAAFVLL